MIVLGYNGGIEGYMANFGTGHDASAAICVNGEIVAAVEEERFNREKHSSKFPVQAIQYCLEKAGLKSISDVDLITYYWDYPLMYRPEMVEQNKEGLSLSEKLGTWTVLKTMKTFNNMAGYGEERTRKFFEKNMGTTIPEEKFQCVSHHLCHAASTFYDSPYTDSLVVTLDASGEASSSIVAHAKGTEFDVLHEVLIPNSLGFLYLWMTDFLGFQPANDEYKVMGLAPYGDASVYRSFFESIITLNDDGTYAVDQSLFVKLMATSNANGTKIFPPRFKKELGPRRKKSEPVEQRHMDIAAALQNVLEKTVLHSLERLKHRTGAKNLCLAGGVALNSTMNGKIARSGLFENVWIHPAAHDAGTSVGGALYGYHNILKQPRHFQSKRTRYWGPSFDDKWLTSALKEYDEKIVHQAPEDLYGHVADALQAGKVVGWYQGRMEWGPRALGNRSILADPRRDDMKDIVNHAVKLREGFRPFAPSCLAEKATEWFDLKGLNDETPYMLFVVPVHEDKRESIPAVTHVDGSARVQTVQKEDNERYHALISAFEERTGVPVILNTSFNIRGEPIVNTPADAIRCFLGTGIDMVVIHDTVIEKRPEVIDALRKKNDRTKWETGRVVGGRIEAS
jgi:carbamoyltransferase